MTREEASIENGPAGSQTPRGCCEGTSMRMSKRTSCLSIVLLLVAAGVQRGQEKSPQDIQKADCLSYETDGVKLSGRIIRKTFPGPPNFESVKRGDAREVTWILHLAKPVCVKPARQDTFNEAEVGVSEVHLVLSGSQYRRFRGLVGKRPVVITGNLFHSFTGHHHARVLMSVSTAEAMNVESPRRHRRSSGSS
jgi:hypothetical protein